MGGFLSAVERTVEKRAGSRLRAVCAAPGDVEITYGDGSSPNISTFAGNLVFGVVLWFGRQGEQRRHVMGKIQVKDAAQKQSYGEAAESYTETIYQDGQIIDRKMNCVFNNPN
jgi:hypothetical protein